ncbi:MAG: DUF523 and DUF1722 domain-containing protein [Planctomycetales bacterium]|nr:DUF523 and DUF1722 domain-containing protein [Planctomycetales bacterium]
MKDPSRQPNDPIRIGISSCLLGEEVRFDGGHKHDRYLTGTLSQYFEWIPVCPEVEVGLGTPRETIRLVQIGDETRLRTTKTDLDLTDRMERFSKKRVAALAGEDLSGYIFKKDSPSCGMERVKMYSLKGPGKRVGVGLFAAAFLERLPNLPAEEEGRLCDPRLRENWVERVFAYHAMQRLWAGRWRIGELVDFHTRFKFVLQAHDESKYRELGRLVANAKSLPRSQLRDQYETTFMTALKRIATVRKNVNVLQHMLGFFSKDLDPASRQELVNHIDDYRHGLVPLVVPMTLIRHYVRLLDVEYLRDQVYLNPHPKELALRNHV